MSYKNNILGKFEDAGNIVRGGRIDQYWGTELELYPEQYIGTKQILDADWLHDTEKALAHFNLRSIEYGNWMSQNDRANFLYASALSLHHLARLLGVGDDKMGLGGKLSISLGARGKGNAAGHYEPNPYAVINITKTKGIGVLAHEFAHAMDNIISYHVKSHQTYVSGGRTTRKYFDEEIETKGNYYEKQFEQFFNILYYDVDGEKSDFHIELDKLDDYWNRRNEVFARTFEVYITEKLRKNSITNHFLVFGANSEAYPSVEMMNEVSRYIGNIMGKGFALIKNDKSLKGIETPTGYDGFRKTLKKNSSLADTLENMQRIARRDTLHVRQLAFDLEGESVEVTASNIWHYLRENTRYKLDRDGFEELRTPSRSLHDGAMGVNNPNYGIDCDDYTILVSSILLNLNIAHEYRVAAYKKKGKFQHIYPVAFDEMGNEYVIDIVPEIPHFNYEALPIIDLKTIPMELQELSGLGSIEAEAKQDVLDELNQPFSLSGVDAEVDDDILDAHFLNGFAVVDDEEDADITLSGSDVVDLIDKGLVAELHKARLSLLQEKKVPTALSQVVEVDSEIEFIDDIIDAWDDEEERTDALLDAINSKSAYANFFRALLHSSDALNEEEALNGFDDEEIYLARVDGASIDGLGLFRKLRDKVKSTVKKVSSGVKTVVKKAGTVVKQGIKAVVRFNPATIALRNASLLVMKINLFGFASKLIYGYMSESQAKAKGLDLNEWRKIVNARSQAEKWFEKAGGKRENLKNAIIKGKAAKKTGLNLNGLGEVATAAATSTAAASPFIIFMKKILGAINPAKLFKGVKNLIKKKNPDGSTTVTTPDGQFVADEFSEGDFPASDFDFDDGSGGSSGGGMMDKMKSFYTTHKKKIMIGGIGFIVLIFAIVGYKKYSKKKKNQLRGLKAAQTRKRNARKRNQLKGAPKKRTYTRKKATPKRKPKQLGRGSTTIIKHPTKGKGKARMTIRSSGDRFKMMHSIAKDLQKKHPKTKYSTLLSRASKMI